MDNMDEYDRLFNMSIDERRKILKEKDILFKKDYFAYDNRMRASIRRQAKKTEKQPAEGDDIVKKILNNPLQTDMELCKDGQMFKDKIDLFFKQVSPSEPVKETSPIIKDDQPDNTNKKEPVKKENIYVNDVNEIIPDDTFYQDVVYADVVIAKSYILDDDDAGEMGANISQIKNYNIKIPIKYLNDIYINLPTNNSRMISDTKNIYIYFNCDIK
tara:strand:- start:55 stop:699 length:645 start_codon:yes stop_codon:yes gene_type:complete